ncbi:MAG: response regulator [Candidatus Omnitrophica bacterium]|nr:response regulator [Candidatus Omnitrophota bacterium]
MAERQKTVEKKKVLVIEDNEDIAQVLAKRLQMASYLPVLLTNGWEVVSYLLKKEEPLPHALILDLMLPGRSGHELLNTIKSVLPKAKIFVFSSHKECVSLIPQDAIEGFFLKTDGVDKLITALNAASEDRL